MASVKESRCWSCSWRGAMRSSMTDSEMKSEYVRSVVWVSFNSMSCQLPVAGCQLSVVSAAVAGTWQLTTGNSSVQEIRLLQRHRRLGDAVLDLLQVSRNALGEDLGDLAVLELG